ncbi:MAG: hypothetical protein MI784_02715 [Cytophagales bacterium]|nr:hypothetical protein [Cytophagales bacterium]
MRINKLTLASFAVLLLLLACNYLNFSYGSTKDSKKETLAAQKSGSSDSDPSNAYSFKKNLLSKGILPFFL